MDSNKRSSFAEMAAQARRDIIRMVGAAKSGHPGGSLSSTDFLTVLFSDVMKQDAAGFTRDAKGKDAFILSAGHITPIYYSLLSLNGYIERDELATFRKFGTRLQGHPCVNGGVKGITQVSGSLGQGLSCALGIALAKKLDKEDNKVFVLVGDGESEEGQIWEAAMFAAHQKVDNVIAMTDWNGQQIDGTVENVGGLGDLKAKWEAFGWNVVFCEDGHDFAQICAAFDKALSACGKGKPVMILFKTEMGHGVDFMAGTCAWHGKAPAAEQVEAALKQLPTTKIGDFKM
ncbi:MAG: transketolase [Bacteroidales bacterium]|nr:transketolase [Bacteroidales bacterium]